MDKAVDKTKTVTQDAKAAVTDSWVTSKTKIELFADDRVKGSQVKVETIEGVVHLRGKVDSADAKAAATSIAEGIDGAKSVKNDLQVVSPGARKVVDAKDTDIAKAVETRLSRGSDLKKIDGARAMRRRDADGRRVPTIVASAKGIRDGARS